MIATNRIKTKNKRGTNKRTREQQRLDAKRHSPGVPPNTCPYIDQVKTMIADMSDAYVRLHERGEHQPMHEDMRVMVDDMLEYIRRSNETLRDNSAYWYNKYKQTL